MKLLKIPQAKIDEVASNAEKMRRMAIAMEREQKGMKATKCWGCGKAIMDDPFYCQECDERLWK